MTDKTAIPSSMYLVPERITPDMEQRAEAIVTDMYDHQITWPVFHAYMSAIGTPITPCADVEDAAIVENDDDRYLSLHAFDPELLPKGRRVHLVRRTDMEARLAIRERTVKATMRALDAKTDHYLTVRNERDVLKEQIAEKDAEIAHLRVVEAEMHLLEEVCAFYANDEDRFIKADGNAEPYGMIPTDVGMKARSARGRFMAREQAAQDAGGDA